MLAGEYYAPDHTGLCHGHEAALFKRSYLGVFLELFPQLRLVDQASSAATTAGTT